MDLIERPDDLVRRHPWEIARARFFLRLLWRLDLLGTTHSWLDVGAGDAWFARQLRAVVPAHARLACWDLHYTDTAPPETGDEGLDIEFSAERPEGSFGGILMLDVIEHVEDDLSFVRDVVDGSLAPRGWLLASVPAYQWLFSEHDRVLKHYRRYSPRAIRTVLEGAGLHVETGGGLFHGLLAARSIQVLRDHYRPPSCPPTGIGAWQGGRRLTQALTRTLDAEAHFSLAIGTKGFPPLPGLSTWALCRRAGETQR